jgi:hypothetical protein
MREEGMKGEGRNGRVGVRFGGEQATGGACGGRSLRHIRTFSHPFPPFHPLPFSPSLFPLPLSSFCDQLSQAKAHDLVTLLDTITVVCMDR